LCFLDGDVLQPLDGFDGNGRVDGRPILGPVPLSADATMDDDVWICRCEEITKKEIRKQIFQGFVTTDRLKKAIRCGRNAARKGSADRSCLTFSRP
jgi:bacterioferritin-associated ferredoxin